MSDEKPKVDPTPQEAALKTGLFMAACWLVALAVSLPDWRLQTIAAKVGDSVWSWFGLAYVTITVLMVMAELWYRPRRQ